MKLYIVVLTICLLTGCQTINEKTVGEGTSFQFYVGTSLRNEKDGIYKYLLKKDGRLEKIGLAAKSNNPSFLALSADRKYLVAVNEISNEDGEGTVESYLITEDSLAFISRSSSGGAHPCFVSVNDEGYVLTANYTGGNLGLLKLDNFGKLSDLLDIQQHSGSGYTDRQKSAHAHSARFDPINNLVIAADLGTNEIWFSHIDTNRQKLIPSYPLKIPMSPGAGPRHMAFHPNGNWLYVVNELDCTVTLLRKDEKGNYQKASSFQPCLTAITK